MHEWPLLYSWVTNLFRLLPKYEEHTPVVSDADQILSILQRAKDAQSNCTIYSLSTDSALAIGARLEQLRGDRKPITLRCESNGDLAPGTPIRLESQLDGLDLVFESTVADATQWSNPTSINIAFPNSITYAQFRQEHRVNVPMDWRSRIVLAFDADTCVAGEVRDLSPTGFSAFLERELPDTIEKLPRAVEFVLVVHTDLVIEGQIEIRYIHHSDNDHRPRIGASITALEPHYQRALERAVAMIDRQHVRLR